MPTSSDERSAPKLSATTRPSSVTSASIAQRWSAPAKRLTLPSPVPSHARAPSSTRPCTPPAPEETGTHARKMPGLRTGDPPSASAGASVATVKTQSSPALVPADAAAGARGRGGRARLSRGARGGGGRCGGGLRWLAVARGARPTREQELVACRVGQRGVGAMQPVGRHDHR